MTGTRIRWEAAPEASSAAWHGYAGTLDLMLFVIHRPVPGGTGYWGQPVLATHIPGMTDERHYDDDPEALKAEAERWLEEYAASLGAVFPEEGGNGWQVLKDDLTGRIGYDLVSHQAALGAGEDIAAASYGGLVSANRSTLAKMRELEAG